MQKLKIIPVPQKGSIFFNVNKTPSAVFTFRLITADSIFIKQVLHDVFSADLQHKYHTKNRLIYISITVHNDTCRSPFIFGWHTSLEKAQLPVELNYTRTPTEDASWLENREEFANISLRTLHLCQRLCHIFLALDWSSSRHSHFGSLFIDEEQKDAGT